MRLWSAISSRAAIAHAARDQQARVSSSRTTLLYAVAAGGAVAEVIGIKGAGMVSTLPLAAQASAVAPIAAFHDVRWLLVYSTGWGPLVGELALTVAVRAAMMALFVRSAWPTSPRPAWRPLFARSALAYLVLLVAMSPWGVLSFASALGSISFPLIAGIFFAALIGIVVLPHAGVTARWWTRWPSLRTMGWSALDFLSVTVWAIVDLVAVSEGTFVVEDYLAHHHDPPVRTAVLSSPLPRPDRVYYPAAGGQTGFGVIAGSEAALLLEVPETEVPGEDITTTISMLRALTAQGPFFRHGACVPHRRRAWSRCCP